MFQINIRQANKPVETVKADIVAEGISDVELMINEVISKHIGISDIVVIRESGHFFLIYQLVGPIARACVQEQSEVDK